MEKYKLYIDGKFVDAETGETRPTINPATEEPIAMVPVATKGDTQRAIAAARKAFDARTWSGMDVRERAKILMKIVDRLRERQEELAQIEAADATDQQVADGQVEQAPQDIHRRGRQAYSRW